MTVGVRYRKSPTLNAQICLLFCDGALTVIRRKDRMEERFDFAFSLAYILPSVFFHFRAIT